MINLIHTKAELFNLSCAGMASPVGLQSAKLLWLHRLKVTIVGKFPIFFFESRVVSGTKLFISISLNILEPAGSEMKSSQSLKI